jgi:two-component system sensor histidine kinase/response regulator
MTANAMQQDKNNSFAAGMNDHLSKPIDPDELFSALMKWIKTNNAEPVMTGNTKDIQKPELQYDIGIPVIYGLDYRQGLKRVLGKPHRYVEMLNKYVVSQEKLLEELKNAFSSNDIKSAERFAHTSKSLNGNIGAIKIQEIAAELEKLFRDGADIKKLKQQFDLYVTEQLAMLKAIKQSIPASEDISPKNAGSVTKAEAAEILVKLKALIEKDDSSAIDYFEEHQAPIKLMLGNENFNMFSRYIKAYDFDLAFKFLSAEDV